MTLSLNTKLELNLDIEGASEADRFMISDGPEEIELPRKIMGDLDTQLELLLSTGEEIIVHKGDNESQRISLAGLHVVSNYLRWVAANQDYSILPENWPVPSLIVGSSPDGELTSTWSSPMPQPEGQNVNAMSVLRLNASLGPNAHELDLLLAENARLNQLLQLYRTTPDIEGTAETVNVVDNLEQVFDDFVQMLTGLEDRMVEQFTMQNSQLSSLEGQLKSLHDDCTGRISIEDVSTLTDLLLSSARAHSASRNKLQIAEPSEYPEHKDSEQEGASLIIEDMGEETVDLTFDGPVLSSQETSPPKSAPAVQETSLTATEMAIDQGTPLDDMQEPPSNMEEPKANIMSVVEILLEELSIEPSQLIDHFGTASPDNQEQNNDAITEEIAE